MSAPSTAAEQVGEALSYAETQLVTAVQSHKRWAHEQATSLRVASRWAGVIDTLWEINRRTA